MNNKIEAASLTAAECACRTGLTVRALRVYEELGLISPHRTASGWRYYGERELIRLNTITLLKSAGLTLAQIRTATHLNEQDPSLRHVLEMQVDAWKAKQSDAARGQAIVEAALKTLQAQKTLSIDDLCNLVRSLEMCDQRQAPPANADAAHEVSVDAKILDSYVGVYRYGEFGIVAITREGDRLYGQLADNPMRELAALSDTEFTTEAVNANVRFMVNAHGQATSLTIYQEGIRIIAQRAEAAAAAEMAIKLAAKIQSQQPTQGSDAALRRLLENFATSKPYYEAMSPVFSQLVRQQLTQLEALTKYLGPIQSITFRGVGTQGWDVYEVRFENGTSQWRIAFNSKEIIEGARPVTNDPRLLSALTSDDKGRQSTHEPKAQAPTRGSEAALRRMIDGIRSGEPNYDEMSPLLAQAIRQQLPMMQTIGNRLGAMVAVEFVGSSTVHYDIFDLQREHGTARWRIALDANGIITTANAMLTESGVSAGP